MTTTAFDLANGRCGERDGFDWDGRGETIPLDAPPTAESRPDGVVGTSPALRVAMTSAKKVAPTDSTVLITGETGTGKELLAQAIHSWSHRRRHPFVSVNCAATPPELIASELFGHERGAFTGAVQRRLGRFERAAGGTLFFDEIGELPAETQVTLLRVLQEREFERVGGTEKLRTDVRVVAATNRDLDLAIDAGDFRSDLYYRLNVFPIRMPPLRERSADIYALVEHFVELCAERTGKTIRHIEKRTLRLLQMYPWPGNVRELQNVVERAVIVSESDTLSVDESWLLPVRAPRREAARETASFGPTRPSATLEEIEREAIVHALQATGGVIGGPRGAAAMLGLKRTTLQSRMQKLGIGPTRSACGERNVEGPAAVSFGGYQPPPSAL